MSLFWICVGTMSPLTSDVWQEQGEAWPAVLIGGGMKPKLQGHFDECFLHLPFEKAKIVEVHRKSGIFS